MSKTYNSLFNTKRVEFIKIDEKLERKPKSKVSDAYFKPEIGENGIEYKAVLRFLPNFEKNGDDITILDPLVDTKSFYYPGGLVEDDEDLVGTYYLNVEDSTYNKKFYKYYKTHPEIYNDDIVKRLKPYTSYLAYILVLNDTVVKDNNGRIFIYRFGKKVKEKLTLFHQEMIESEDNTIFSLNDGYNFNFVKKMVGGYPNYDSCNVINKKTNLGGVYDLDTKTEQGQIELVDMLLERWCERINIVIDSDTDKYKKVVNNICDYIDRLTGKKPRTETKKVQYQNVDGTNDPWFE